MKTRQLIEALTGDEFKLGNFVKLAHSAKLLRIGRPSLAQVYVEVPAGTVFEVETWDLDPRFRLLRATSDGSRYWMELFFKAKDFVPADKADIRGYAKKVLGEDADVFKKGDLVTCTFDLTDSDKHRTYPKGTPLLVNHYIPGLGVCEVVALDDVPEDGVWHLDPDQLLFATKGGLKGHARKVLGESPQSAYVPRKGDLVALQGGDRYGFKNGTVFLFVSRGEGYSLPSVVYLKKLGTGEPLTVGLRPFHYYFFPTEQTTNKKAYHRTAKEVLGKLTESPQRPEKGDLFVVIETNGFYSYAGNPVHVHEGDVWEVLEENPHFVQIIRRHPPAEHPNDGPRAVYHGDVPYHFRLAGRDDVKGWARHALGEASQSLFAWELKKDDWLTPKATPPKAMLLSAVTGNVIRIKHGDIWQVGNIWTGSANVAQSFELSRIHPPVHPERDIDYSSRVASAEDLGRYFEPVTRDRIKGFAKDVLSQPPVL